MRGCQARGYEVVLCPGEVLFLPAWWWHEVETLPAEEPPPSPPSSQPSSKPSSQLPSQPLTVSVNFWFEVKHRQGTPHEMPLGPAIRLELARQLEVIVADALDSALPVAPFLRGLRAQLECSTSVHECSAHEGAPPYGRSQAQNAAADATWPALEQHRPAGIVRSEWEGLFEYVIFKGSLLLGPHLLLPFVVDLCDATRFERLLPRREATTCVKA